ncbi:unnamed protein product [Urochloa humidicola]
MASFEVRRHCYKELSLGRRPAQSSACAREEEKAPATPCAAAGVGLTATELQATAILGMARREDTRSSMRRSLEWFLLRRREAGHRRGVVVGVTAGAATSPSSSSSSSCLTD